MPDYLEIFPGMQAIPLLKANVNSAIYGHSCNDQLGNPARKFSGNHNLIGIRGTASKQEDAEQKKFEGLAAAPRL